MMRLALAFVAMLAGLSVAAAQSSDLLQVYDRTTLEQAGEGYQRTTNRILDQVIWPNLLENERQTFGGKPLLQFPLYGEGQSRSYPLLFYAYQRNVVFPVFSLKLLEDLCIAYAWLQLKGYAIETISDYTAILRYGPQPPSGFPPPLRALGIPANALGDKDVDELARGHFVTARAFLLLHEMGHILYHHQPTSFEQSVRNEEQADLFAATVMQRTPLPPLGILVFFVADAHWSAFPGNGPHTHPLTGARVTALASHVDSPTLALKLRELGKIMDDPDLRAALIATGKAGDLAALGPRHPGELPRLGLVPSAATARLFDGFYRGQMVQFLDPEPRPIEATFQRQGDRVTGRYTFGLGFGNINGQIFDQKLRFDWNWAGNYGRGELTSEAGGGFIGTWGYREATSGAGTWTGQPVKPAR